jgi:hypothetical protein
MHVLVAWAWNLYRPHLPALDAKSLKSAGASAASALLFGLRLSTSVCLALYIAFWFQLDDPYWAGTSASVAAQPRLGASLRKGRFRAIGTVIGGLAIVMLTAAFPQDHPALLVSLAVNRRAIRTSLRRPTLTRVERWFAGSPVSDFI